MSAFIFGHSPFTPTGYASSGDTSRYPKGNVGRITRPALYWQGTTCVADTTYVGMDLGAVKSIALLFADDVNVEKASWVYSSNGSAWTWVSVSPNLDPVDGRYKDCYVPAAPISARYVRFYARDNATADGTGLMRVGSLACCATAREWVDSPQRVGVGTVAAMMVADYGGRTGEAVRLDRLRAARWTLSSDIITATALDDVLWLMGQTEADPLVFYRNDTHTSHAYLCRKLGTLTAEFATATALSMGQCVLEEYA